MNTVPHHVETVIIGKFHLREHARTNQAVTRLTRDESRCVWNVEVASGERFVTNLPGIRHIKRFLIFAYHEVRFIAFRRYPFTAAFSRLIKGMYARNLRENLEKYIADDRLRQHMMPDYELGCRRVIPTNTYLPALARDNVEVDTSGIERITPTGIRAIDARSDAQRDYVAGVKKLLQSTVWQTGGCTAFYRKDMTGDVTSLSPESVVHFILSRQRVRLEDYQQIP